MSHLSNALRAGTAAALIGGFACLGTATASADPNTGNPPDIKTLAASLSKSYNLNDCQPAQLTGAVLAELDCGQSPDPNGPASAVYQLFNNATDVTSAFGASIKAVSQTVCGDSGQSPTPWHQGSASVNGGSVACGTTQNLATIVWTIDSKNVVATIVNKGDVPSLYKWWQTNG